ncbi:MAG TPA: anti-sigma factor [Vicinamibacterales bacterium]|nr:anti-sigma factor [Vicinamibacterales bacterium]
MTPEPDLFREATGLYVLGALDADERRAFEAHLRTCDECIAEVRSLRAVAGALPHGVSQVDAPDALRSRVLAAAAAARTPSRVVAFEKRAPAEPVRAAATPGPGAWAGWIAAAASLLLVAGLGMYAVSLRARLDDTHARLADATTRLQESEQRLQAAARETTAVRASLALLTAPDAVELHLAGQPVAPAARGRAFLSRSRGLLFAATNLPAIPNDRTYQLWFLTPGAPVSAGLLRPDAQGTATAAFDVAPNAPVPTGMAVSLEPDGGVPAPTGALYLVGQ